MNFAESLKELDSRKKVKNHTLIRRMLTEKFSKEQIGIVLGQWYHPLRYFPMFVSRMMGITPSLSDRTILSKILWQELGQGELALAHEQIYIDTMSGLGFSVAELSCALPFAATRELVGEFEAKSADQFYASTGYVFATESVDLIMVSSIGKAVSHAFGVAKLPWVDIHVSQEPEHTSCVDNLVVSQMDAEGLEQVLKAADAMFTFWCNFFTDIETAIDAAARIDVQADALAA